MADKISRLVKTCSSKIVVNNNLKGQVRFSSLKANVSRQFVPSRSYTSGLEATTTGSVFNGITINLDGVEGRPLYLDAQATTPMDPRVLDSMLPYFTSLYGNPHSRTHAYGWESEKAVETARKEVADLIGADPKEIIFTSGATESNNIAVKGVARFYKSKKNHVITTQTVCGMKLYNFWLREVRLNCC
ncbi:unnamed protein product [Allacma fusca]|uniref:Aminotransferase class V domain-containing protein n=2 Tax=Allacma fusca TaxID=39272 RepID=A0A8J2PXX0_9HEXA|nr:unnamed protein product [Allacma fusca]